jgi:ribosome-associated protein
MKVKIPWVTEVSISGEYIKLDQFLKFAAIAETGGMAKDMIAAGDVSVGGEVTTARGRKLHDGAIIAVQGKTYRITSKPERDEKTKK